MEELLKKMERKVGEKSMSIFDERLSRGIQRFREEGREKGREEGREEGRLEGKEKGKEESKKEIAENMLNLKLDENLILKTTKIKRTELEKLKKELIGMSN